MASVFSMSMESPHAYEEQVRELNDLGYASAQGLTDAVNELLNRIEQEASDCAENPALDGHVAYLKTKKHVVENEYGIYYVQAMIQEVMASIGYRIVSGRNYVSGLAGGRSGKEMD